MIRVVTSTQSAARDASAIDSGIPSRALMQRAGAAAAAEIALRYRDWLSRGVIVFAGPGNNGGDAWVVARALAATGVTVRVVEPVSAKTADCIAERALALNASGAGQVVLGDAGATAPGLIVDGLLGTGGAGAPRGELATAARAMMALAANGLPVVALDLPSGVDASTGDASDPHVRAALTISFGTIKRAHLVNRDDCGAIVVVDIGLGAHTELSDAVPRLVDESWVGSQVPGFSAAAHKGIRRKVVIVGGAPGMVGAAILSARAALRSGVGMVRAVVAAQSVESIQQAEPAALTAVWPHDDDSAQREIVSWADAVAIGPGLGRTDESRDVLERVLRAWKGPVLLDADALTLFENNLARLAELLDGRPALITPHYVEFSRLTGIPIDRVIAERFDVARDAARTLGAVVLLKGVPTVITSGDGAQLVSATGTPALATGGSGDVLSGIAVTLLAQIGDPFIAGAAAAWVHGRAAERVPAVGAARGIVLDDIVDELRRGWSFDRSPSRYPVLAELPAIVA
jgi:ADP-dependent NAD(P)H-hydrate dehydratase / NAD(P)H-hydrate epimerase